MSIIFCPECGTQVSEHAQQCMKCSYPIYKLKNYNGYQNKSTYNNYSNNTSINKAPINSNDSLIIWGYVVACLSFLILPVFFLLIGIVIGIITIAKGHSGHGIAHIVLSIILGTIGTIIGTLAFLFS
jgi:ribosomal protein L40E